VAHITIRFDDHGDAVVEGWDPTSPLALLLARDLNSRVPSAAVISINGLLRSASKVADGWPVNEHRYDATRVQLEVGAATVRSNAAEGGQVNTIDLQQFSDLLLTWRRLLTEPLKVRLCAQPVVRLYIQEEFGFAHWAAILTNDEYRDLLRRWETMRGLNCCVPVARIVPQAERLKAGDLANAAFDAFCHVHECDDSYLDGSGYMIPDTINGEFCIDGDEPERPGDCPPILVSKVVSAAQVETGLADLFPGVKLAVAVSMDAIPLDAEAAVLLTRRDDPEWPVLLEFVYLPLESALGEHPHLTMAPHLAERLEAKTLTDSADC
jgi:hypothetical protein